MTQNTATATMTAEARAARARYMREWRKRNPEKQRQYSAAKWERKAAQYRAEKEAGNNGNEQVQN